MCRLQPQGKPTPVPDRSGWKLIKYLLIGIPLIWAACGGDSTFELTVVNTLQSSETIRVDLGGEVRSMNIGDFTVFRSVTQGQHILSIESLTCTGTIRDTLSVNGDITIRYLVTRDLTSGECLLESNVTATQKTVPLSLGSPSNPARNRDTHQAGA